MYGRESWAGGDKQLDGMFSLSVAGFVCDFVTNCHEYWEVNYLSLMYGWPSTQHLHGQQIGKTLCVKGEVR
jgi:hypothetical protein